MVEKVLVTDQFCGPCSDQCLCVCVCREYFLNSMTFESDSFCEQN